jgi:hypothetical protein
VEGFEVRHKLSPIMLFAHFVRFCRYDVLERKQNTRLDDLSNLIITRLLLIYQTKLLAADAKPNDKLYSQVHARVARGKALLDKHGASAVCVVPGQEADGEFRVKSGKDSEHTYVVLFSSLFCMRCLCFFILKVLFCTCRFVFFSII